MKQSYNALKTQNCMSHDDWNVCGNGGTTWSGWRLWQK